MANKQLRRHKARRAAAHAAHVARKVRHTIASLPASILLLGTATLLPVMTFAAAYRVSDRATDGDIWLRKGYFLSAAIDVPPASNFGSLGLTVALAAFAGVAVVRHHVVRERLVAARASAELRSLHSSSLVLAVTAAFGGHGVAAYQHHASRVGHNGFAATFVLTAIAHFLLESTIERRLGLSSALARATRLSLVVIAALGCATFICHVVFEETYQLSIGIGKLVAAVAEIVTCLCFLVYLATYSRSFHETQITLTVTVPTAPPPPPQPQLEPSPLPPSLLSSGSSSSSGDEMLMGREGLRRCVSAAAMLGTASG